MNAIVIVFMPADDAQPLTQQASVLHVVELLRQGTDSNNTQMRLPETSNRDQTAPPFWTWFIENPRRGGA